MIRLLITLEMRNTLKSLFKEQRIRSGLFWNLLATMAGRMSGLLVSIVISRTLGREGFGAFSIIQTTILTFGVLAGFGTGLTATKHIAETFRLDPIRSGRILAVTNILALGFGSLMAILLIACAPVIAASLFSTPHLTPLLQIASISLIASALSGAQSGALAGFEAFSVLSKVNIYSGIVTVIFMSAGVIWGGIAGAIWGFCLSAFVSCLLGARALHLVCKDRNIIPVYRNWLHEWPMLLRFSLPSMLANILVLPVTWLCNAMLVNQPYGLSEVATYNAATQWRQLLLFLPSIASQVFLPILASKDQAGQKRLFAGYYQNINIIITLPFLIVLLAVSPLIMSLYGKSYMTQWPVFVIVQVATFVQIVQSPVITAWAAEGHMWTNLVANCFWATSLLFFTWILIGLGALGLGVALLISFLLYFFVIWIVNNKVEGVSSAND